MGLAENLIETAHRNLAETVGREMGLIAGQLEPAGTVWITPPAGKDYRFTASRALATLLEDELELGVNFPADECQTVQVTITWIGPDFAG